MFNKVLRKDEIHVRVGRRFGGIDHVVDSTELANVHVPPVGQDRMRAASDVNPLDREGKFGPSRLAVIGID